MNKRWNLTLVGCDDSTTISVDLDEKEVTLLKILAEAFEATSTRVCIPTLDLEPAND